MYIYLIKCIELIYDYLCSISHKYTKAKVNRMDSTNVV